MARVGGGAAYPDVSTKCAALLHSLARNRALVDGNGRLALAGAVVLLGINGARLTSTNDQAYDLVMDVAAGRLAGVAGVAGGARG